MKRSPSPQARVEHLHLQNKELLSHVQKLMLQVQQLKLEQAKQPATEPSTKETKPTPAPSESPTEASSSHDEATLDKAFTIQRQVEETHDQETLDKAFSPAHSTVKEATEPSHNKATFNEAFTATELSNL